MAEFLTRITAPIVFPRERRCATSRKNSSECLFLLIGNDYVHDVRDVVHTYAKTVKSNTTRTTSQSPILTISVGWSSKVLPPGASTNFPVADTLHPVLNPSLLPVHEFVRMHVRVP
jgi:hypothetical protein